MKVPALVPEEFSVPEVFEDGGLRIRQVNQDDVAYEFEAVMSCHEFLRNSTYFDPTDQPWPLPDTTVGFVWSKLGAPAWDHYRRSTFHYGVFDLAEMKQLAGFTVSYSRSRSYDAQVTLWTRQSAVEEGMDATIFALVKSWLETSWPLERIAFPGWESAWEEFSRPKFVPDTFVVPNDFAAGDFFVRLMGPHDFLEDMKACFDDVEHLQGVFGPDEMEWPMPDITPRIHLGDLGWCDWSHYHRHFFAYCVYTGDMSRQRGCIYVHPTPVAGYDAEVVVWVTRTDFEQGFDAELFDWVRNWVESSWPFGKVGYPGRETSWDTWSALPEKA